MCMPSQPERRRDQIRDQAAWEAKREINLRIVLQNLVLCLHTTIITGLLVLQILSEVDPWLLWLVGIMSSTMLAQIWLHSGIRHVQLRRYFEDVLDVGINEELEGWESFVHRMHPDVLLGARWWISTKAIFAYAQLGMGIVAIASSLLIKQPIGGGIVLLVAGIVFGVITIYSLQHPRLPDVSTKSALEEEEV